MIFITPRQRAAALATALLFAAQLANAQTYNFSTGRNGFTAPPPYNQWGYDASSGQWFEIGQMEIDNRLVSPIVTATGGAAKVDLSHTFSFDALVYGGQLHCRDAGIFTMSVNGGAFTPVAATRGTLYNGVLDINSGNPMYGQNGFCANPTAGSLTSSGWDFTFAAGDKVQFGFDASWDRVINSPSSSWRLSSVELTGFGPGAVVATPEPSSVALLATGLAGLLALRRKRRHS